MDSDILYTKDVITGEGYSIGDYTYGKPTVYDWNDGGKLIIGKYTSIADGVKILLGGNHQTGWVTTYPFPALNNKWPEAKDIKGHPWSKGDVKIGNDVWIASGVTILSGVTIGDGAVIAAASVVVKDVPAYTIVAGNPAKVVKERFDSQVSKQISESKWWDWTEDNVRKGITLLCSNDIKGFIDFSRGVK